MLCSVEGGSQMEWETVSFTVKSSIWIGYCIIGLFGFGAEHWEFYIVQELLFGREKKRTV